MPETKTDQLCAECKKPAELKCSACKSVSYCSKEHQKSHWKTHKIECKPFEIKELDDVGRCLVAIRDLNPGDLILSELPLVIGPRPHMVEKGPVPCPGCCRLIIAEKSPRCEGCDWPVCFPGCEGLRHPERHGHECLILALRPHRALDGLHDYYRQDSLLALRCLLLQTKGIKKWTQFLSMQSHMEKRGKNTAIYKDVQERVVDYIHNSFLLPMKLLEEKTNHTILPDTSKETLHRVCGIIDVNALEINQEAELSALYPTAYLMEHSCASNTAHNFEPEQDGGKIVVRAALPIKKGEHITTMYTHALWGTQARREHLRETKYFTCRCVRCADPTELGSYLSALMCMGATDERTGKQINCGGVQLPVDPLDDKTEWACSKCPIKLANSEVSCLVNHIGEEVDHIQLTSPTVKDLDQLLTKMLTFLHPNHYHVFAVQHSLIQLYGYQQGYTLTQITDELLQRKATLCRQLIATMKKIDRGSARLALYSSVTLHELYLANVTWVKRRWEKMTGAKKELVVLIVEAKESIEKASTILKNETNSPAGGKLLQLVGNSIKDLEKLIENYQIDLKNV